ncbi:MAG: hypothetical protein HFJ80_04310 [Clostridiales bacterium]|nr:hypothetical protein [Clostridiales bacterium]
MIGFTFRGKHCYNDYGLVMRSKDRTVLPSRRKRQLEIPLRHGMYDFEGSTYNDRVIQVDCFLDGGSGPELRRKIRRIALWLSEPGRLRFDDEPELSYQARIYSAISLEQVLAAGLFSLLFECRPFARGAEMSVSAPITKSGQQVGISYGGTQPAGCRIVIENTGTTTVSGIMLRVNGRNAL